ncbi:MAG: L-histidine N(alpha)-methyltransferase, partial [Bacteroidota bacterium]
MTPFAADVLQGLSAQPKKLSSKWFYDERGDELFQAIMASPEYYLTNAEREIFRQQADRFYASTGEAAFDLVELGAGDGTKTQYLVEYFLAQQADFRYLPIDISQHALDELSGLVKRRWPDLNFAGVEGDYFEALANLPKSDTPRLKMVLFPGANIGNFSPAYARQFLNRLRQKMAIGDLLVIGFDLKKDPARILAAYNDKAGHTRDFNLNLLRRINRELDADFDLEQWMHWPTYDPVS